MNKFAIIHGEIKIFHLIRNAETIWNCNNIIQIFYYLSLQIFARNTLERENRIKNKCEREMQFWNKECKKKNLECHNIRRDSITIYVTLRKSRTYMFIVISCSCVAPTIIFTWRKSQHIHARKAWTTRSLLFLAVGYSQLREQNQEVTDATAVTKPQHM